MRTELLCLLATVAFFGSTTLSTAIPVVRSLTLLNTKSANDGVTSEEGNNHFALSSTEGASAQDNNAKK